MTDDRELLASLRFCETKIGEYLIESVQSKNSPSHRKKNEFREKVKELQHPTGPERDNVK